MENENELEVNSDDTQEEETNDVSENEDEETSEENPDKLKIKELEGQKNYYQSQYKKLKDKKGEVEPDRLTRDEALLIAQGYSEKDLETLNTISKGKGISLKEAKEDELFKVYKSNVDKEEKSTKAQLGASGGSPTGNSKEDHEKKYNEALKKLQG